MISRLEGILEENNFVVNKPVQIIDPPTGKPSFDEGNDEVCTWIRSVGVYNLMDRYKHDKEEKRMFYKRLFDFIPTYTSKQQRLMLTQIQTLINAIAIKENDTELKTILQSYYEDILYNTILD